MAMLTRGYKYPETETTSRSLMSRASKCLNCIVLTSWSSWADSENSGPQVENQSHPETNFLHQKKKRWNLWFLDIYTLWLFNIAMENGPFIDSIDGLPIKNGDFPWLC